jgi:hypothetical protein
MVTDYVWLVTFPENVTRNSSQINQFLVVWTIFFLFVWKITYAFVGSDKVQFKDTTGKTSLENLHTKLMKFIIDTQK